MQNAIKKWIIETSELCISHRLKSYNKSKYNKLKKNLYFHLTIALGFDEISKAFCLVCKLKNKKKVLIALALANKNGKAQAKFTLISHVSLCSSVCH